MSSFVEVYANALVAFDRNASLLFAALQDQIVHSAEELLQSLEVNALKPAVTKSQSVISSSMHAQCTNSTVSPTNSSYSSPLKAAQRIPLLGQVNANALQAFASSTDKSSDHTLSQKLEKELTTLYLEINSSSEGSKASTTPATDSDGNNLTHPVFLQLSTLSQAILAFTALWLCTKFWGTVSESSTLSGLVACFIRQPPSQPDDSTVQHAALNSLNENEKQAIIPAKSSALAGGGEVVEAAAIEEPLASVGGVQTAPITVCSAFTPPRSPVTSAPALLHTAGCGGADETTADPENSATPVGEPLRLPLPASELGVETAPALADALEIGLAHTPDKEQKGEEEVERLSCTHAVDDEPLRGPANEDQHIATALCVGGCDAWGYPLLPPQAGWGAAAMDVVDAIAREVEDAEMMLLRSCRYSIPV